MKPRLLLTFCLVFGLLFSAAAQQTYTDYKPNYRVWFDGCEIEKIEYRADAIVLHFWHFAPSRGFSYAIFYAPNEGYSWILRNSDTPSQTFKLQAVKNVYRNGKLVAADVRKELNLMNEDSSGAAYVIYRGEVHFEKLPKEIKAFDLIEGEGQENNANHFNCFNIQLKPANSKDLGTEKDAKARMLALERQLANNPGTAAPKPEPKPDSTNPTKIQPPKN